MTSKQIIKLAKIGFVFLSKQTELQKTASNKKLITAIAAALGLGGAAYAATGDRPGAIGDWADEAIKDSTRWGEGTVLDANQLGTNAIDDITKLFGGGRDENSRVRDNAVQDIQQWLHSGYGNVEDLLD